MNEDEARNLFRGLARKYPLGPMPTMEDFAEAVEMSTHNGDFLVVVKTGEGKEVYGVGPLSQMDAVRVADRERRELDEEGSQDYRIVLVPYMGSGLGDE